jgi:LysM repeat protein
MNNTHKIALTASIIILVIFVVFLLTKHSLQTRKTLPSVSNSENTKTLDSETLFHESNPRSHIIDYTATKGDTIYSIAKKFSISAQTIEWANNLTTTAPMMVGQTIKILPVNGIAYKVTKGDTIYSIAKKYHANPQAIADFYGNKFANSKTLELIEGSIIIIPNGSPSK